MIRYALRIDKKGLKERGGKMSTSWLRSKIKSSFKFLLIGKKHT